MSPFRIPNNFTSTTAYRSTVDIPTDIDGPDTWKDTQMVGE